MFRDSCTGTIDAIREHITSLKLPGDLPEHNAIRAFVLANVPKYGAGQWQYSLSCESVCNTAGNRMSGFMSISAMEVQPVTTKGR